MTAGALCTVMTTFGFASGARSVVQNPESSQVIPKRYQLQYVVDIIKIAHNMHESVKVI